MNVAIAVCGALGILLVYEGLTHRGGRRRAGAMTRLDRIVAESGLASMSGTRLIVLTVLGALVTLVVVAGITASIVPALAFAAGAAWLPFAYVRSRRQRRRRAFREAWPDAIANLISGIRAGISLPEACVALGGKGPRELQGGFRAFATTYRATGNFRSALDRLSGTLADPVADRVVVALDLAHEVGGTDLVRVLRTLADFVREDLRVRREIEARWSWTVTAARVAAAAPWAVLLMMATRPEAAVAYNSSTGAIVIGLGALATVLGYRLMLRAARLPDERRLR